MSEWHPVPGVYTSDSPIHGKGLFARTAIDKGACIGRYEGERTSANGMHVLWVEGEEADHWLGYDGTNVLRFLNHSSTPNAELDGQDLYARTDIAPGEEITIDYGEWFESGE